MQVTFATKRVGDVEVFNREVRPPNAPVMLLHGFPTSGHMFRDLILKTHYIEIAGLIRRFLGLPGTGS